MRFSTILLWGATMLAAFPALGEDTRGRMLTPEEAVQWRAVAKVNLAGNRSCSGVLISDREVLTAAHCLFHPVTQHRADPKEIKVVLGLDRTDYAVLAGVAALAVLPGFVPTPGTHADLEQTRHDLALLQLSEPVPAAIVTPLPVADWAGGGTLDLLGYGRDRAWKVSLRADCPASPEMEGVIVLLCAAVPGLSGAPAVARGAGGPSVAGIVSAQIVEPGQNVQDSGSTLVVPVAPHLAELRAALK